MFEDKKFSEIYRLLLEDGTSKYTAAGGCRLGLDFGTSYTKVAYAIDGDSGKMSFKLGDKTKPSVVYFDENDVALSMFQTAGLKQIHFFKATMTGNEKYKLLKANKVIAGILDKELRDNFELLCSIFFIANIINYSSLFVSKVYNKVAFPSVAMGIPMSWSNEYAVVYNKALYAALYILQKSFGKDITRMPLQDIYNAYKESSSTFNNDAFNPKNKASINMTIPEVVTEMNHFLNNKSIAFGNYFIVDIGGGTADFAFITKQKLPLHAEPFFYCKYAIVRELGDCIREVYKVNKEEGKYESLFTSAFNECCCGARKKMKDEGNVEPLTSVRVYLLGGGAQHDGEYYKSILTSKANIEQLDNSNISIEVICPKDENESRYIIAEQLSYCDKKLKLLAGIPMHDKN